jgi:hypothetical protein
VLIDHVALLAKNADETAQELRSRYGLGLQRGAYLAIAGTRMHTVWLRPPQYLEFHTIEDRAVAESTKSGRTALAAEAGSSKFIGWAVLVEDVGAVSERLGIDIVDYTVPQEDGTLRGWRAVSGPSHLPFFIDYPNNGDRLGRMQALYEAAAHTSAPTSFTQLTISGSQRELNDWLGPHDLPLRVVDGNRGLCEARIATATGVVTFS